MGKNITVWFDKEGDFLEVLFDCKKGYFRETGNDAVMEKVDEKGNIIGFSVMKVSAMKAEISLSANLVTAQTA
ncbi:MAG: hypothetical protein R2941_25790 [Desulfobacterales bacterium]